MVGTVVQCIYEGAGFAQFGVHVGMDAVQAGFVGQSAGNNALVGYDDAQIGTLVQQPKGLSRPREEVKVLGAVDEVGVFVDHAVPVQEHGHLRCPQGTRRYFAAGQGFFALKHPLWGAHVLDVFGGVVPENTEFLAPAGQQVLAKVGWKVGGDVAPANGFEQVGAGIYHVPSNPSGRMGFGEDGFNAVFRPQNHQVRIVRVVVGVHQQGGLCPVGLVERRHALPVHVCQNVAVDHQNGFVYGA